MDSNSSAEPESSREPNNPGRRRARILAIISGLIVIPLTSCVGLGFYTNWAAERHAREFCEAIEPGSDISIAIARADEKNIHHNEYLESGHTFLFPGFVMDMAECDVSVDRQGRVASAHAEMLHD